MRCYCNIFLPRPCHHRRIQGGPGGHVPPLDRLKCILFLELFCLRLWRCLAKLAYWLMWVSREISECVVRIGPACGDHGKFLLLLSPHWIGPASGDKGNFCYYPPPPPTEMASGDKGNLWYTASGRLLETKEISAITTPPPLNRAGFWRQRKFLLLPPPVSCCAPPRLPALDPPPPLVTYKDVHNVIDQCKHTSKWGSPDNGEDEEAIRWHDLVTRSTDLAKTILLRTVEDGQGIHAEEDHERSGHTTVTNRQQNLSQRPKWQQLNTKTPYDSIWRWETKPRFRA